MNFLNVLLVLTSMASMLIMVLANSEEFVPNECFDSVTKICFPKLSTNIELYEKCCSIWDFSDCMMYNLCVKCGRDYGDKFTQMFRDNLTSLESEECSSYSYGSLTCNWFQFKLIGPIFIGMCLAFSSVYMTWAKFFVNSKKDKVYKK